MSVASPLNMRIGEFVQYEVKKGIRLFVYPVKGFKSASCIIVLRRPLDHLVTSFALLPQLLRQGSFRYPHRAQLTRRLNDLYGATFSMDTFKTGEMHVLASSISVPSDRYLDSKKSVFIQSVDFVHQVLTKPMLQDGLFRSSVVDLAKQNHRSYLEGLMDDKRGEAFRRCVEETCRNEPYGIFEQGYIRDLDLITAESLTTLYQSSLRSSPIDLYIGADIEPDRVCSLIGDYFPSRPEGDLIPIESTEVIPPDQPRFITDRLDVQQANIILAYRTFTNMLCSDIIPMMMFTALIGNYSHSRLFQVIREQEGLAYHIDAEHDHAKGILFVHAGVESVQCERVVELMQHLIGEIQNGIVRIDDFESMRKMLLTSLMSQQDSLATVLSSMVRKVTHGWQITHEELETSIRFILIEDVVNVSSKMKLDTVYMMRPEQI